ncbi:MAG: tRNA (N6-isopentenyl adenosine(37)-C2)-methylthiotransferase MiaB [Deltaproteobacteria bacterium]|nr:tRNA (N6-isopentenyl adenosine(37)-C2)-methylthiotransferase MiaB [Deltaproteobacteria bacterium]
MGNALENSPRRVFLETFGCQMNDNDSERILGLLERMDYARTEEPDDADLIIINTCSVRDKAEQKVYSMLGRFKALKDEKPGIIIGVSGCVAQQQGETLLKRAPYLDLVFGPHNIHRLGELITEVSVKKGRIVATAQNETIDEDEYGYFPRSTGGIKAFVSIMRGCNNFCAYCIVPYTRGREVSRNSTEVVDEVKRLADSGVLEVTLLGQNVNSYGVNGDVSFPELLRRVAGVEGLKRVRFVTSHPKDISRELIGIFGEVPKLCRHMHLPVQSGSNAVLKTMGRGYTKEDYIEKVTLLKGLYPEMSLTTDIIVGFPGESEEDFSETVGLLESVRFDNIFSFMYSPRPNTRAATFGRQVPPEVKSRRLQELQGAQREITLEKSKALVGKTLEVLVEGVNKTDGAELSGRTICNRIVNFPAPVELGGLAGSLIDISITRAFPNSLRGVYKERSTICC